MTKSETAAFGNIPSLGSLRLFGPGCVEKAVMGVRRRQASDALDAEDEVQTILDEVKGCLWEEELEELLEVEVHRSLEITKSEEESLEDEEDQVVKRLRWWVIVWETLAIGRDLRMGPHREDNRVGANG